MVREKPVPVGYYILALCEAGYMYAFSFKSPITGYAGVNPQQVLQSVVARATQSLTQVQLTMLTQLSATSKAVLQLLLHLPNDSFFHLYCDNLFSNPDLFHILRILGVAACGTARATCKNWPQDLKKFGRKRDRLPYNFKLVRIVHKDVAAIIWQDKNMVQFLSTGHELNATIEKERRRPNAHSKWMKQVITEVWGSMSRKVLELPAFAVDYNNHMGGVDRHDQLRSYHPTQQKAFRTWLSLFFFLVDSAVINAYIICKQLFPSIPDNYVRFQRNFRIRLAWNLVNEGSQEMLSRRPMPGQPQPSPAPSISRGLRECGYVSKNWTPPATRFSPGDHNLDGRYPAPKSCVHCRWLSKQHIGASSRIRRSLRHCTVCGPRYPLCRECAQAWHTSNTG